MKEHAFLSELFILDSYKSVTLSGSVTFDGAWLCHRNNNDDHQLKFSISRQENRALLGFYINESTGMYVGMSR